MIFLHTTPMETWGDSGAKQRSITRKCPCLVPARDFIPIDNHTGSCNSPNLQAERCFFFK